VNAATYLQALNLACGGFLLLGVLMLWRREQSAIVTLLAGQGVLVAVIAVMLGVQQHHPELYAVAGGVVLLKVVVLPTMLRRVLRKSSASRENSPLVNIAASMLAAALLTLLAYALAGPLVELAPTATTRAVPVGLATVFLGIFLMVTRRRALSQAIGFLLLDNGIAVTALLTVGGVPLLVELGVLLDLLMMVLVLQVLTARLRTTFGHTELDELRELHD